MQVVTAAGPIFAGRLGGMRRTLALAGVLGLLAALAVLVVAAASSPTQYVPAHVGGWPGWLSGPLRGTSLGLGSRSFEALMLGICAAYGLVLVCARALSLRIVLIAVAIAHALLLLGPPLISQDVFGYLAFARMGALHGLDPYTHVPANIPSDAVTPFIGWPFQHSPYGPLFTLASYATAPLGVAGGLWALKACAALASFGAVVLIARAAGERGRSPAGAAAFLGLNPVLLVLAVGGAHNDALLLLAAAAAILLAGRGRAGPAALSLAAGVGVKVTAGLLLVFLVIGRQGTTARLRVGAEALAGLLAVLVLGVAGFGTHALGFLNAVGEQQQLVATHSIPAETARLFSLTGTPKWWRDLFVAAFVLIVLYALWRVARGADWVTAAGWSTLALLLCTAWLLPWYAIWVLPLAAVSDDRRLRGAALLMSAYAVAIHLSLAGWLLSPAG
ncbi:MAG TPA: glycosyltransferase family 87 protein [Solirubrobacteraceae bacterium]|jgi:hypothetical protein|nr:glycosyltransferase family 87 protein [Solirubrobacteraceae bacterium]